MEYIFPANSWFSYIGGVPATNEHAGMLDALPPVVLPPPSKLKAVDEKEKPNLLARLKERWNDPKVRDTVGKVSYVVAVLFALGSVTAFALHFSIGNIAGFPIKLSYAAMGASFAALAVLKGLQFREEARLMQERKRTQEQIARLREAENFPDLQGHETLEDAVSALTAAHQMRPHRDTPKEQLWKVLALVAGLLMLSVFTYQMIEVFKGASSGLKLSPVTLVSAVGVLSYSLTLVSRFFYQQRKELAAKEAALADNPLLTDRRAIKEIAPAQLQERRIRLLPNRLGKLAVGFGSAILGGAVALLIARYGFNVQSLRFLDSKTLLSMGSLVGLGIGGGMVVFNGLMQVFFYRDEKEIAAGDAKIKRLERETASLRKLLEDYVDDLESDLIKRIDELQSLRNTQIDKQRRNEKIQKIVGSAVMLLALSLLVVQLLGLDSRLFRSIFHTTIPNDLMTTVTVLSYAIGIAYTGIALITNAMEHRQDIRGATLENEKRALDLKLQYYRRKEDDRKKPE